MLPVDNQLDVPMFHPSAIKVFLGSTYADLMEHRRECIAVLSRKGFQCVGMELWGASTVPPLDLCLRYVRESSLFLGLFGTRYGHVIEALGRSITELEYREAIRSGLPCLIYLIDEKAATVPVSEIEDDATRRKLRDFKEELRDSTKGHVVGWFQSPVDLARNLLLDIERAGTLLGGNRIMTGLREQVDRAVAAGVRFILDMEIRPSSGWTYYDLGSGTSWDTAFSLLALVASGLDGVGAALHRGQLWLMQRRNRYGGWRSAWERDENATTTVDTPLAVLAVCESGYEERPDELGRSVGYLRNEQRADGGWGFTFGTGGSTTAATAWAVRALIRGGMSPDEPAALRALRWLTDQQRFDGGWAVERSHPLSTIGETCDALMGLALFPSAETAGATARARDWLLRARGTSAAEDFGARISSIPQGTNQVAANVLLFLEAAAYAGIPPADGVIRGDLEWIAGRRLGGNTPRAVWCLSQHRKWVR